MLGFLYLNLHHLNDTPSRSLYIILYHLNDILSGYLDLIDLIYFCAQFKKKDNITQIKG